MPIFWNNIWVVTKDELVPKYYNTIDTLQKEIQRYKKKDYGVKQVQRGGNGRLMLISFDSLPSEIQNAVGDPRKITNPLQLFYKEDNAAVTFYTQFKFEDGNRLRIQHQEEYIINASVLLAAIQLKSAREYERKTKGGSCKGVMTSLCNDVIRFNEILKKFYDCQHSLPASEKRFKETFKEFSTIADGAYNYGTLISGKLRNENRKLMTDELLHLLNNLFAGQGIKPTRTEVSRQYEAFMNGYIEIIDPSTGECFDPKNYKSISESAIVNYLNNWEDRIGTNLKRSGDRQKYIGKYIPHHSFDMPEFAGEILSIDDRQPPFEYAKGQRSWLYMGIDIASQAWTVCVHGKTKEGIIVEFYRQLIRNYTEWGFKLPAELECESSLNSLYKSTFLREGAMFDHVNIIANNARSKYIERMFGKLRYEKEKDKAGWIARPFSRKEDNQIGGHDVPIIPYDQIINNSLQDIETWNSSPHPDHEGMTRWDYFSSKQHPALKETNWSALLPYLGHKTQTSCNAGIIKLNNSECLIGENGSICTGKRLIELMKDVEGRNLDVYWIDGNDGNIMKAIVFLRGDDLELCEAILKPTYSRSRIGRSPQDDKNRALMSAYANTIESYARERKNQIKDILVIDNRPSISNGKFKMPMYLQNITASTVAPETPVDSDVEIIDDGNDMDPIEIPSTTRKSLKDRF